MIDGVFDEESIQHVRREADNSYLKGGIDMRIRSNTVGIIGGIFTITSCIDIRRSELISQVSYSAWIGAIFGLLLLGHFIFLTMAEQ